MIVAVIVGGAILIGSVLLFGPMGLLFALLLALCGGWIFGKSDEEANKKHAKQLDQDIKDMWGIK